MIVILDVRNDVEHSGIHRLETRRKIGVKYGKREMSHETSVRP